MPNILILLLCLFTISSQASSITLGSVQSEQFTKGQEWTWSYSEWDSESKNWKAPYLYERYKVIDRRGDLVTISMASDSKVSAKMKAHHKFQVNLKNCFSKSRTIAELKKWKIRFYTANMGAGWQLVSSSHKNLAFTEKFNCLAQLDQAKVKFDKTLDNQWNIFHPNDSELGWYYLDHPELTGVSYLRLTGRGDYKVELIQN